MTYKHIYSSKKANKPSQTHSLDFLFFFFGGGQERISDTCNVSHMKRLLRIWMLVATKLKLFSDSNSLFLCLNQPFEKYPPIALPPPPLRFLSLSWLLVYVVIYLSESCSAHSEVTIHGTECICDNDKNCACWFSFFAFYTCICWGCEDSKCRLQTLYAARAYRWWKEGRIRRTRRCLEPWHNPCNIFYWYWYPHLNRKCCLVD